MSYFVYLWTASFPLCCEHRQSSLPSTQPPKKRRHSQATLPFIHYIAVIYCIVCMLTQSSIVEQAWVLLTPTDTSNSVLRGCPQNTLL